MKYVIGIMVLLYTLVFASVSMAACTGCGEEGHQQCVEDPDHSHETDQDHGHIEGLWLDHKHETTALQPFTWFVISSSVKSRLLLWPLCLGFP